MAAARLRPTFVISLDEELVWGSFDHTSAARFAAENPDLRGTVRQLLALFDRHRVPATWAIVGHLFLGACARDEQGRAHPELVRPRYTWYPGDWLAADPCSDRARQPLWYGDDLIEMIREAPARHEIGCHSFSHIVFGDPGCSREAADSDLRACVATAERAGLRLRSFVFPRNLEGHHDLLARHGFIAYRGQDPTWFRGLPSGARRLAHLADQAAAWPPPVTLPRESHPGLWNLPGSMLFLHRGGVRGFIPFAARLRKIKLGLRRAVDEGRLFHLWFHPFNMSRDREGMFEVLEGVLREAAQLRDRGALDILTMGDLAEQQAGLHPPPVPAPRAAHL